MKFSLRFVFCVIIFFSFVIHASGQIKGYAESIVQLESGKKLEGYIKTPLTSSGKFVFKTDDRSEKQKIEINDVESILFKGLNNEIFLEATKYELVRLGANGPAIKSTKLSKFKVLLMVDLSCPNIKTYHSIGSYSVDQDGNLVLRYVIGFTHYFIKREIDDYPIFAGQLSTPYPSGEPAEPMFFKDADYALRKELLVSYFEEEDEIVNYINSQSEFSQQDMFEYVATFCEEKGDDTK